MLFLRNQSVAALWLFCGSMEDGGVGNWWEAVAKRSGTVDSVAVDRMAGTSE